MCYIFSVMSAEELGSGPRSLVLSPGVCFTSGGVGFPLMGHFLLSFHIPGCIKMTNFMYRLRHRLETVSNSAE